jgi:hypothetical protein
MNKTIFLFISCLLIFQFKTDSAISQSKIAQESQNPIGNLTILSLQNDLVFGVGSKEESAYSLRAGLIFPVSLGEKVDLVNRWFMPLIFQEASFPDDTSKVGLSDLNIQALLTPSEEKWFIWGELKWGLGASVFIPTNTNDDLGTDKLSIGPMFAFVREPRDLVYGFVFQNVWSVAGDEDEPDINEMILQYFFNYNFKNGWYLTSSNLITANWKEDNDNRWTVPIGGGVGKVIRTKRRHLDFRAQTYWLVEKPQFAPDWGLQLTVKWLFTKKF